MNAKPIANLLRDRRGMTLVEMMIAVTVFGMIMGVVMGFLVDSRDSYTQTRSRAQTQQGMRAVLSLLTAEIRSAGCDPQTAGFDTFGLADAATLQIRMDLNGDGDVTDNDPDETVTWTYNAATDELSRNGGNGDQVLLRRVTAVTFNYFDANGALLAGLPLSAADRAQVRTVEVILQGEAAKGGPVDYTTRVALRNI
ncbi:MAG: prepilin-type N-terminal cleavage/methylation domain-containing protein [Krumholzibacteria bacterium]|nr:prepilin-type N-terminal cleavage/methylation domain-containing protein [Candidatus Krumholzibacteria bacterium]